jgi:predicted nucleic-acid-binding protein
MVGTVWVLTRAYGLSNHAVAAAVERILQADTLLVQNEQETFFDKKAKRLTQLRVL